MAKLRNNIFYSTDGYALRLTQTPSAINGDYNLFYRADGGRARLTPANWFTLAEFKAAYPAEEVNSTEGNPLFVNSATDNFRLQLGSPAIDAGDPNFGTSFPGGRIDIGAFEFGG